MSAIPLHTAEWTYEVHELFEGYSAIVYDEHGQAIADHLDEATARLIAAAPELLEALEGVVRKFDTAPGPVKAVPLGIMKARRAIAKATGAA